MVKAPIPPVFGFRSHLVEPPLGERTFQIILDDDCCVFSNSLFNPFTCTNNFTFHLYIALMMILLSKSFFAKNFLLVFTLYYEIQWVKL